MLFCQCVAFETRPLIIVHPYRNSFVFSRITLPQQLLLFESKCRQSTIWQLQSLALICQRVMIFPLVNQIMQRRTQHKVSIACSKTTQALTNVTPLDCFRYFMKLPYEVSEQIWDMAVEDMPCQTIHCISWDHVKHRYQNALQKFDTKDGRILQAQPILARGPAVLAEDGRDLDPEELSFLTYSKWNTSWLPPATMQACSESRQRTAPVLQEVKHPVFESSRFFYPP